MITRLPDYAGIENEIIKQQLTAGLRKALDRNFVRLREAALREWERSHPADPSDACVSVRIHAETRTLTA